MKAGCRALSAIVSKDTARRLLAGHWSDLMGTIPIWPCSIVYQILQVRGIIKSDVLI